MVKDVEIGSIRVSKSEVGKFSPARSDLRARTADPLAESYVLAGGQCLRQASSKSITSTEAIAENLAIPDPNSS